VVLPPLPPLVVLVALVVEAAPAGELEVDPALGWRESVL
jgi:hypothetical protein